MRIVFLGTPQFAVPSLEQLLHHPNFDVVAVVTQPDKRRGRGNQVTPSPVKATALPSQCPILQPRRIKKDAAVLETLSSLQADAFVVVAYGQILSKAILDMPRLGCINAHGSLLPPYRGAAPIQWCLYHGETETGITTMLMDEGMDTGAMLLKSQTPIGLLDTALDIAQILSVQSGDLLVETLQQLAAGTLLPTPQDEAQATYAPLIHKDDYALDWSRSALDLHNQVRGFFPNCFTHLRGEALKVIRTVPLGAAYWPALPETLATDLATAFEHLSLPADPSPGAVVGLLKSFGPVIQTGEGYLLLREVKPSGKKAQSGQDFVNGSRLLIGEEFDALAD